MPELLHGDWDAVLKKIDAALGKYEAQHPGAEAALYRHNSASIRVRVIDSTFEGLSIGERSKLVWPILRSLPEEVRSEITVLLLLTPEEAPSSFANADFASPLPSSL